MAVSIVTYEKRDRIAWITLNRAEAMNALNPEVGAGLGQAFGEATKDDDVLVVILAGAGGRAFSAGMDLKWRASQDAGGASGQPVTIGHREVGACPKPVIAAIDGYCLAGGMQLANRCDIRIATEQSRFGMLEARRGLAAVGVIDTPEMVVPAGEAALILMTGGMMTASRAYDIGLIQALAPDRDALFAEAERLANEIKLCAPLAVQAIKAVLRAKMNLPGAPEGVEQLVQLSKVTQDARERNSKSEDQVEGPKAFAEGRAPVWKGR